MKKILMLLVALLLGAGAGAGGGYGTTMLLGPHDPAADAAKAAAEPTAFVPVPRMVAPLVLPDGRLSGYVAFELQLEVGETRVEEVTARLPFFQNAMNLRTYRTPIAAGIDGNIPDIARFRDVAQDAANQAFGKGAVRRVAVTQAVPA